MGAIIGTVVSAAALALFFSLRKPSALPLKMGQLPSDTVEIGFSSISKRFLAERTGLKEADYPDEALWSAYAVTLCGGPDVFRELLSTRVWDEEALATELGDDKDATRDALRCGKEIAKKIGTNVAGYQVRFKAHKDSHRVMLLGASLKALPDTAKAIRSVADPDHFDGTRCEKKDVDASRADDSDAYDRKSPCKRSAIGKLEGEDVFVAGDYPGLKAFGDEYSRDGKNKIESADALEKTLRSLHGDDVRVFLPERDSIEPLPSIHDEDVTKRLARTVRDAQVIGFAASMSGGWTRDRYEFHMANEGDAKDLEDVLGKYARELARDAKDDAVDRREKTDEKDDDDRTTKEERAFGKAKETLASDAAKGAKITRNGGVVTLDVAETPSADDKKTWDALEASNASKAKKVAAIIAKLVDSGTVDPSAVRDLAPKVADALDPPEWTELKRMGGIKVPGNGKCRNLNDGPLSCEYRKGEKEKIAEKVKAQAEKDGFTVTKSTYSDSTYAFEKDGKTYGLDVLGMSEEVTLAFTEEAIATATSPAPVGTTGSIPECDAYIEKLEACSKKIPAMAGSIQSVRDAFSNIPASARASTATACQQASDAIQGVCP